MANTLLVFLDKFDGEGLPDEVCQIPDGYSINRYLTEFCPSYDRTRAVQDFSISVDGAHWPESRWDEILPADLDVVAVREGKGAEILIPLAIAALSAAYTYYQMKKLDVPDTYNNSAPDGSNIYSANAQANQLRLMSPSTELLGRHLVVPDYLSAPYSEIIGGEEWLHLLLRVSVGQCSLPDTEVYIGDTAAVTLGTDVDVQVFQPGQSVAGHAAHRHMYTMQETAGSGIKLSAPFPAFSYTAPRTYNSTSKVWIVQADTRQMQQSYCTVKEDGSVIITAGQQTDWRDEFEAAGYDTNLAGAVINIYGDYYRVIDAGALATFHKVDPTTLELIPGWTGFGSQGDIFWGDWSIVNDPDNGAWNGWFGATPTGQSTSNLFFEFRFAGLCKLDTKNVPQYRTVTLEIQYREKGTTSANTTTVSYTEATLDELAYQADVVLPYSMEPEVRVRVTTLTANDATVKEECVWTRTRAELPTRTSYPEYTVLAFSIRGTHRLSSAAQNKVRTFPTRMLPLLQPSGGGYTWTAPQATRNPIAAACYIAKTAGNMDATIDLEEMYSLQQLAESRGEYFDGTFDTATTAWEAIKRVLAVILTKPIAESGKIVPVRDEQSAEIPFQFTEDNITDDFEFTADLPDPNLTDRYDGAEVEYMDETTWKSSTVTCLLPHQAGTKLKRIRAYGVINKDRAERYGMAIIARDEYRDFNIKFKTGLDGIPTRYMDPVEIGWTIPGIAQTGIVTAIDGQRLRLSVPLEWTAGQQHVIRLRRPNGRVSGPYAATKGADDYEVVIGSDLDFEPVMSGRMEAPTFAFGVAGKVEMPCRIIKADPAGTESVSMAVFLDDERAYQYDDLHL